MLRDNATFLNADDYERSKNKGCPDIEGSFMWAIYQMKKGKKFRGTGEDSHIILFYNKEKDGIQGERMYEDCFYDFNLEDIERVDWEIYEDNKFGPFEIIIGTNEIYNSNGMKVINPSEFDDLEKAIKRAKQNEKQSK